MPRPRSSRVGVGALVLLGMNAMLGLASASSPENKVSMEEAARKQLSRFRAQKSPATQRDSIEEAVRSQLSRFRTQGRGEEDPTTGAASVPGPRAPSATSVNLAAPAGKRSATGKSVDVALNSATGARIKLMSTSQREALSARMKYARAAAGDLMGKVDDQPPQNMVGTGHSANDVTSASSNGGRRKLQSCADGLGVTVTSSMFPLLEGCLVEADVYTNDGVEFVSSTGAIVSAVLDGETSAFWLALYGDTTSPEELVLACFSAEPSSLVHPSEATWICGLPDDGSVEVATPTTFGVDCGCDSGPLPAPTPSPPTPTPPTPTPGGSCAEGSGVTVTSSEFPLMEGCLEEVDFVDTFDGPEFVSATGLIIYNLAEGQTMPLWAAFYGDIAAAELELACYSEESADLVHPSGATWICSFDGTFGYATSTSFSVDCGCDDGAVSPAPAPTAPAVVETPAPVAPRTVPPVLETPTPVAPRTDPPVLETPAPVPAPTEPPIMETPAPTPGSRALPTTPAPEATSSAPASAPTPAAGGDCAADSSLGVTSTDFPLLEGCLEVVALVAGGEFEYVSSTGLIVALAPDETAPTLEYWYAGYGDTTTLEGLVTACRSEEPASAVHPSEATWICLDAADDAYYATGSEFAVDCGCSTAPAPGTSAPVSVVEPTAQPVAATTPAPTAVPSAPAGQTGELSTPEPTAGPSATGRGLESTAPTPSSGLEPIGVPGVVFPDAATPAPSAAGTIAGACGATESFQIISSALPDVQGCFQSTVESFSNPESFSEVWTVDGTTTSGQIGVIGWKEGGDVELDAYLYFLAYVSSAADGSGSITYCFSSELATTVHPADATWNCDLDGTQSYDQVTDADISFLCGCTGTPAPASGATPITAPTSSPNSAPTDGAGTASGSVAARVLDCSTVGGATALVAAAVALAVGG